MTSALYAPSVGTSHNMAKQNTFEDVFKYVEIKGPDDCWPWTGPISRKGLPYFTVEGRKYTAYRVTKWLVTRDFNILDESVVPMHQCKDADGKAIDNPLCCNPAHTVMGSHEDNMLDMMLKGRSGLTKDVIRDILSLHDQLGDSLTHGQIADRVEFKHQVKVSRQAVTDILNSRRRAVIVAKIREEDAQFKEDANGTRKQGD
jgi:hypothetical protein